MPPGEGYILVFFINIDEQFVVLTKAHRPSKKPMMCYFCISKAGEVLKQNSGSYEKL
jgi:hypothetical protein